jgi:hypothetical protein
MRLSFIVSLGLFLGFLVASACGGRPPCNAQTCPLGCCDTTGVCAPGNSSSACGQRGAMCTSCGVTSVCSSGTCQQNIGSGAGSAGAGSAGGGTAGGGSAGGGSAGGGSAVGGGLAVGGGAAGGGSAVGGGSAGGSSGGPATGGGSAGGGSSPNATAFCTRLGNASNRFFAGRPSCPAAGTNITPDFTFSRCVSAWTICTTADRMVLDQITSCLEVAPVCSPGNEAAAAGAFLQCFSLSEALTQACIDAI